MQSLFKFGSEKLFGFDSLLFLHLLEIENSQGWDLMDSIKPIIGQFSQKVISEYKSL
jgi:hypothetical protein